MLQFFLWYIAITILGLLTFPLAYRILPALPDRGYAFSRSLGLLIWAFIFWLAVSLGLSQNNIGGLVFTLAVLVGLSLWANWRVDREKPSTFNPSARPVGQSGLALQPVVSWFKPNLRYVLSIEILFFLAFALLAFVRANNPDLTTTEKPMEMAFINAIIHSPTFPPHDPWLSDYAISYYYFGYVMTAMLAEITSTIGSVAFNLMISLIFGLGAIGAYGLVYNLLRAYWQSRAEQGSKKPATGKAMWGAFLAPFFLLVSGNWEALLDVLHKRGVGWAVNPDGSFALPPPGEQNFWTWLDILELKNPPGPVFGGILERFASWWSAEGFNGLGKWFTEAFMPNRTAWWWWRASRVLSDRDLRMGDPIEIIDEFPAFSYLLGDLHPHVLAAPFGLLIGALALNLYLGGWKGETRLFKLKLPNNTEFELKFPVRLDGFILLAVALGGMAFLNTWAFPIYLGLVSIALVLMLVQERGWSWDLFEEFFKFSIPLAVFSVVLYLPFYIGFSSQAGGIIPNIIFPTRGAHLWVMFGGLFTPMLAFLAWFWRKEKAAWKTGFLLAIGFTLFLWAFSTILGIAAANTDIGHQFITSQGLSSTWDVLREATVRRLLYGGGLLTLLLLIGGALAYLTASPSSQGAKVQASVPSGETINLEGRSPMPFVFMFILFGGLLVLAPDFVYLRDQFGNRMNTIFKFYYEAWALWAIAATFVIVVMLSELRAWASRGYAVVVLLLVGVGLIYPVLGVINKTNDFQSADPQLRTLDGAAYLERYSPDEYQAIRFLEQAAPGTVAEAVGGQYSDFARVSLYSGHPTVLGWPGHESQWRGSDKEMGTRQEDIATLYTTHDWDQAQAILKQYGIRYIYIGGLERQSYNVYEEKFSQNLSRIFSQGQVAIYVVP